MLLHGRAAAGRRAVVAQWARGLADLGPGRKDYSDPGFQRKGYVHEGFFSNTVKQKTSAADKRCVPGPDFVSYSWATDSPRRVLERHQMRLRGFAPRDRRAALLGHDGFTKDSEEEDEEQEDEQEEADEDSGYPYTGGSLADIAAAAAAARRMKRKP